MRYRLLHGPHIAVTPEHIFGVLSLIFWSLVLVILLKYVGVVLNADNKGEARSGADRIGGQYERASPRRRTYGLLGIWRVLFFADGAITPAISVLSAVEGCTLRRPPRRFLCCRSPSWSCSDFRHPAPWHRLGRQGVRTGDARMVAIWP